MISPTLNNRGRIPVVKRIAMTVITSAAALGLSSDLYSGTPVDDSKMVKQPLEDFHPMYLGTFNTGVKTSDVYTEGNVSFVVPVWSSLGADGRLGGGMAFITPYVSLGEQGELAASLGLGWRYLFSDQPVSALRSDERAGFMTEGFYVGANVFVDNLRTHFDNDFWQLGIGAEIGSRYVELRGNYYLPFDGGQKLAERRTDTQAYTTRSTTSSSGSVNSVNTGAPIASGNTLQQDAYLTTTAVTATRTTTTRTTVTTVTELYEEGREGWDLEAAFLIPGIDQYLDVSVLAGYYSFDNQPFGPQRGGTGRTEGWKTGLEIRPVPAIVLTGMWYEDEGLTGSDWVAGIGLQIPLSKDWKDAFKPRRRHLIERLGEPVARQNAAIKTSLSYDQKHDVKQTSSTQTAVKRRVVNQSSQRITIAEDVIFVNNGGEVGNGIEAGSSSGDGTAENPLNTIQAGADLAGNNNVSTQRVWNVYTQGAGVHGGSSYNESVTISASTNFLSSASSIGYAVTGINGTGDRPLVIGGFAANAADFLAGSTLDHHVGIDGYSISGGYQSSASIPQVPVTPYAAADGDGIHLNDLKSFSVVDNVVQNASNGINVRSTGVQDVIGQLAYNKVSENTDLGINLFINGAQSFTGDVIGNIAWDNGRGIRVFGSNQWTGDIGGNEAYSNDGNGLDISIMGTLNGDVRNNTTYDNSLVGLTFYGLTVNGGIHSNVSHDNVGAGITLAVGSVTDGIYLNQAHGNGGHGLGVSYGFGPINADIHSNYATGNSGSGMFLGAFNGDVYSNISSDNGEDGIRIWGIGDATGNVWGNLSNGNGRHGISIDLMDLSFSIPPSRGSFTGDIYSNSTGNNGQDGINVKVVGGFDGDIYENQMVNNTNFGLRVELNYGPLTQAPSGDFNGNVYNNVALNNSLSIFSRGEVNGNVNDNYVIGGSVYVTALKHFTGNISGNTVAGSEFAGIVVSASAGMTGDVSDNVVANNGVDGIRLNVSGTLTGNIVNNTSFGNLENGIHGVNTGGFIHNGSISGNTVFDNGKNGILWNAGSMTGNVNGNLAYENIEDGIHIAGSLNGDVFDNVSGLNGGNGILVGQSVLDLLSPLNFEGNIYNNTTNENIQNGILINGNVTFTGDIHSNTANGNELNGIAINTAGFPPLNPFTNFTGDIYNNQINGNVGDGLSLQLNGVFKGNIEGNEANSNDSDGIAIFLPFSNALGSGGGRFEGNIANNDTHENGENGISALIMNTFKGNVSDNRSDKNGQAGIGVNGNEGMNGDFIGNRTDGNGSVGLSIAGAYTGNVHSNISTNNGGHGLSLAAQGPIRANIYNNTITDNMGDGLVIKTIGGNLSTIISPSFTGDIYNNVINYNGGTAINATVAASFIGNVTTNQIIGNGAGILIQAASTMQSFLGEKIEGNIQNNILLNNVGAGIVIRNWQGLYSGDVTGNYVVNSGGVGIQIITGVIFNTVSHDGDVSSNVIAGSGAEGLSISAGGQMIGNISDNAVSTSTRDGVHINVKDLTGNVSNNLSIQNQGAGINFTSNGDVTGNIQGNTASYNIGSGLIFSEGASPITFNGAFSGNTAELNAGYGFSTGVTNLAPGGGPYSPNTAGGNILGNFNNAGAPIANP